MDIRSLIHAGMDCLVVTELFVSVEQAKNAQSVTFASAKPVSVCLVCMNGVLKIRLESTLLAAESAQIVCICVQIVGFGRIQ